VLGKMLIATRFGLGIKDPAWFEHRFALLSAITAPSLMAQEDQRFEWVLFVDPGVSDALREELGPVLAQFEDRVHIWSGSREPEALSKLVEARSLADDQDHLLVGRIDDDDAWARQTITEVRARVERWRMSQPVQSGYGVSFESGLVWRMYDMVDMDQPDEEVVLEAAVRGYTCPFTSISGFTYARVHEALRAVVTGHASVEGLMLDQHYAVDVISTGEPMWLYCRHKQTDGPVKRGEGPELDLTINDLAKRFGISMTSAQHYISNSHTYGYVRSLRMQGLRAKVIQELKSVNRTLTMLSSEERRGHKLLGRRASLLAELEKLSVHAIRKPDSGT
jgi:hypothetical protein